MVRPPPIKAYPFDRVPMPFYRPGMARTIHRDHKRYLDTYFNAYKGYYFTGDGVTRDSDGYCAPCFFYSAEPITYSNFLSQTGSLVELMM